MLQYLRYGWYTRDSHSQPKVYVTESGEEVLVTFTTRVLPMSDERRWQYRGIVVLKKSGPVENVAEAARALAGFVTR